MLNFDALDGFVVVVLPVKIVNYIILWSYYTWKNSKLFLRLRDRKKQCFEMIPPEKGKMQPSGFSRQ